MRWLVWLVFFWGLTRKPRKGGSHDERPRMV